MALIVLYVLSILAILLPYEPLKLVGILISICFLPGLCLFAFGRKTIVFRDLILSFLCSIGISSILILAFLYLGVNILHTPRIIIALTGIAILVYLITGWRKKSYAVFHLSVRELIFCLVALLTTLLLSLPVILGGDSMHLSAHSFFHSSITTQILNGTFPPENPGLGGISTSYFWGGNAFLAALSSQLNLHPLKINSILNILSLFMFFCIIYCAAKAFDFSEAYRYFLALAVIGLMRSDAIIMFIAKLLSGNLLSLQETHNLALAPWQVMSVWAWSDKLPLYDARLRFLDKFYNAGFMPLSICLIFAYFLILLLLSKNKFDDRDKKVYLIALSLLVTASIIIYLPLAIVPILHIPIWAGLIFMVSSGTFKEKFREFSYILLPFLIAILLTLPYMLYVKDVIQTYTISPPTGKIQTIGLAPTVRNIIVFWLPFPVIVTGIWLALKRFAFSKLLYFLLTSTILFFGLSVFIEWGGGNSYKFAYILLFFFAFFFVFALLNFLPKISNRWLKGIVTSSIIIVLLSTPFLVEASYFLSSRFRDATYTFSGKHIIFSKDTARNEAYAWIRENTHPDALVMLTYIKTKYWDCAAHDIIYWPTALTERNLFVIMDSYYVMTNPEYRKRTLMREKLFKEPENPEVSSFFESLNRPVYLLVEGEFNELPENFKKEFPLMFHNDRQKVYLIHDKL